jgi:hypothetical protein
MTDVQDGELKGRAGPDSVIVDNRTGLPDEQVRQAVMAYWVESAALQFGTPTGFQIYATNQGSNMLARSPFQTPSSVMEEIRLARQVAGADDDVRAVLDQMVHTAFRDGMENQHPDIATLHIFNAIAKQMNMDLALKELLREYIIAAQVNTLSLFTRSRVTFQPTENEDQTVTAQMSTPLVGVLPAENVRLLSNDVFSTGELAYEVDDQKLKDWLDEFFDPKISPAKKDAMRRDQPVIAAVFTGTVEVDWNDQDLFNQGKTLYKLNPRMVHRTTMPKGSVAYPRPRMTANFALLEAKRLLNIMDYSLLQGGTNYIVVAKVGSDQLPAQQPEVDNLTEQVRTASRTGVLVGDHRITIEIITPDLKELLNASKRKLLGRKIAMALLSVPEQVTDDGGGDAMQAEMEFAGNTITSDRHDIKRHVERFVYEEIVKRNPSSQIKSAPTLWFPRVILAGVKDFYDNVVKARDRGDIPRKYAVEVLGFNYEAAVAQREREQEAGHDEIMIPGSVPFSSPATQLQSPGRPVGSGPDNGRPGARRAGETPPSATMQRRRGESVRAHWDVDNSVAIRVGELTAAVVEEFPQHSVGRVTSIEREAVEGDEIRFHGPVCVVPVNPAYEVGELRAFRLDEGLSMIVGQRLNDSALVAKALCFREPHFDLNQAEEMALRWGFVTSSVAAEEEHHRLKCPKCDFVQSASNKTCVKCGHDLTEARKAKFANTDASAGSMFMEWIQRPENLAAVTGMFGEIVAKMQPQVTIVMPDEADREIMRDEHGAIIGTRVIPRVTGGGS